MTIQHEKLKKLWKIKVQWKIEFSVKKLIHQSICKLASLIYIHVCVFMEHNKFFSIHEYLKKKNEIKVKYTNISDIYWNIKLLTLIQLFLTKQKLNITNLQLLMALDPNQNSIYFSTTFVTFPRQFSLDFSQKIQRRPTAPRRDSSFASQPTLHFLSNKFRTSLSENRLGRWSAWFRSRVWFATAWRCCLARFWWLPRH